MNDYYTARVLIWGKTYPELSRRYTETVCTGGVLASGQPVRLYPVPLRYLNGDQNFRLYDWIDIPIIKAHDDSRPESFRVKSDAIVRVGHIKPDNYQWAARREAMFKFGGWQFDGMAELKAAEEHDGTSLGIVTPGRVEDVRLERKSDDAEKEYNEKMQEIQSQRDLFLPEYKELGFRRYAIKLLWRCGTPCAECTDRPHDMQVLDWGLMELARKHGWDWEAARNKLAEVAASGDYDFRLFLGNMKAHRKNFTIVGLWYPKLQAQGAFF